MDSKEPFKILVFKLNLILKKNFSFCGRQNVARLVIQLNRSSLYSYFSLFYRLLLSTWNLDAATDPPVCKPSLTRYYGVSRSENVEIACEVEANPSNDLTYKWYFNNSAETIEVPRNRFTADGSISMLTYRPMASLDYGTLLCYATNAAGSQSEPCVFHILTAGWSFIPSSVSDWSNEWTFHSHCHCKTDRSTGTRVQLHCLKPLERGRLNHVPGRLPWWSTAEFFASLLWR